MKCKDLSRYVADELGGELQGAAAEKLHRHLMTCAACREEVASLRRVWDGLGELADEEPSPEVSRRFHTFLEAYEEGRKAARPGLRERLSAWLSRWWPKGPLAQLALVAAALVLGVGLGLFLRPAAPDELQALRGEVATLHRVVSLSLLREESASARLQGVAYSRYGADDEVLSALLRVLDEDRSDNVRLAAVEALARFADRDDVAAGLTAALPRQSSPLVQVALVDLLLELGGEGPRRSVQDLARRRDLDESVRGYVTRRLGGDA